MAAALPEDDLVLIGDVVDVVQVAARRRRPVRLLLVLVLLGGLGWMVSRYVASRKRRALPATAVVAPSGATGPGESPDGEAAPDPVTSANGSGSTDAEGADAGDGAGTAAE